MSPPAPAAGASWLCTTLPSPPSLPFGLWGPSTSKSPVPVLRTTFQTGPWPVPKGPDLVPEDPWGAFEGRDGQAPMQEFLQQSEKQHDNTRTQRTYNRKT